MSSSHLTIITGASRGLGLALARQLMQPGHTLILVSRNVHPQLSAPPGARLEQWQHDLADAALAAERLREWLADQPPARHASATLINNAGVIPPIVPLSQSADAAGQAALATALRVGLEAPMLLSAVFLSATGHWKAPRKVLNISSGLGRRPMASTAAYCAAKAGMDHFTRCLALEEAGKPQGARVCALAPGVIDTDMQVQLRGAQASDFPDHARFVQLKQAHALASTDAAAQRVLAWLHRADFGAEPVADLRSLDADIPPMARHGGNGAAR
ncbi:MAG: short-chain dehydrogenase [Comamonas sp. SCN 65-56]|uniref:SDR family NAD(P)-dependent oxidoreductase n=1 Tax=Comamonas sp. SCN 65-56 TaxID=1660095 RepID=UPI00086D7098|nr:SDR family NAD(P)-dependent oxidoreductase [Comamonas sp. SCN 65-56]ODS92438.1 MAG: short-chain dehydrogenase [Comamonas sp. SCN 65-56]